jgi:CDP-diacylglycerol--serine O-phosphatidyltransferase
MKIKENVPNFFTLCNLLCGCIAIVFAFDQNLIWSAYIAGIACVFDFSDGLSARILKTHSELGKQLDSLADMVSFGLLPGILMFRMLNSLPYFPYITFSAYLPFLAFLIPVFSAIRLAKFNLDTRQSNSFLGLPTPANTILIASLPLIMRSENILGGEAIKQFILHPYFLICLTIISSVALIAPFPLFALKFKNFSWADNKVRYIFLMIAPALLVIFKFVGIPLIIILYIVLSVINNIVTKNNKQ